MGNNLARKGRAKLDVEDVEVTKRQRPLLSPEAEENYMISLAVDLAKKQMIDGTASAAVITHYLRLGTEKAKLERAKLENENKLLDAKAKQIASSQDNESLAKQVLDSMKDYGM